MDESYKEKIEGMDMPAYGVGEPEGWAHGYLDARYDAADIGEQADRDIAARDQRIASLEEEAAQRERRIKELEEELHQRNQKIGDLHQKIKGLVSKANRLADNVPFWEPYANQ